MNINIEKYKKGNFILTDKHIYAQHKLQEIKSLLLQQIGGSSRTLGNNGPKLSSNKTIKTSQSVPNLSTSQVKPNLSTPVKTTENPTGHIEIFNKQQEEIITMINKENANFQDVITQIETGAKDLKIEIGELINADNDLNAEFASFMKEENLNKFDDKENDKENIKKQLNEIQKGLYKLQVKIIFQKLSIIEEKAETPVQKANITKLLEVINKKIATMNTYIDTKEKQIIDKAPSPPKPN
jgi:hypothetical protein